MPALDDVLPLEIFDEPYPCEGCEHAARCKAQRLSCESFHIYATEGGRLDLDSRSPDPDWYHKTFLRRGKADRVYERLQFLEQSAEYLGGGTSDENREPRSATEARVCPEDWDVIKRIVEYQR